VEKLFSYFKFALLAFSDVSVMRPLVSPEFFESFDDLAMFASFEIGIVPQFGLGMMTWHRELLIRGVGGPGC
jgi:hypothetical protein